MDDASMYPPAPVETTSADAEPTPTEERTNPPGSRFALLQGVRSRLIQTSRLHTHYYESGEVGGVPLVLVHGNASSARFFEEFMTRLPQFYVIAPDMRGYGASEALPVDATRGLRDFSEDLHVLIEALDIGRFHIFGWSLGGNIAMQYVIDHSERVRSLTLHAPGSPYGFGGTSTPLGLPNYPDFAGSGGGLIGPQVVARYQAQDDTADTPFSPRHGLRNGIVKPGFAFSQEREDALVEQMLMMRIGDHFYPGDRQPSPNWPGFAPGVYGANNALSPKYLNQEGLADLRNKPPVLWLRGADDAIVSDTSFGDPANLGKMGVIPGYPGEDICPPQPMVSQIRSVLDRYRREGGEYTEVVFSECGHAPLIEKPDDVLGFVLPFLLNAQMRRVGESPPMTASHAMEQAPRESEPEPIVVPTTSSADMPTFTVASTFAPSNSVAAPTTDEAEPSLQAPNAASQPSIEDNVLVAAIPADRVSASEPAASEVAAAGMAITPEQIAVDETLPAAPAPEHLPLAAKQSTPEPVAAVATPQEIKPRGFWRRLFGR